MIMLKPNPTESINYLINSLAIYVPKTL